MKSQIRYSLNPIAAALRAMEPTDAEKAAAAAAAAAAADKAAAEKAKSEAAAAAAALATANAELVKAREQLKLFEGVDPAKAKEMLKAQQEAEAAKKAAEEAKLAAEGNWDALKKQMNTAHQAELAKKEETIVSVTQQVGGLNQQIADLTVGNAFGNSKFIADEVSLTPGKTRVLYGPHFEFKDGKVVGFDKPAGAKDRTMLIQGNGEPLPFEEAIKKLVESDADADRLLKSKLKPGAGSGSLNKGGEPGAGGKELSGREKIAAGLTAMSKAVKK